MKEIIPENLKTLEIKQITLNKDKFGVLTFDRAYPLLHKLRKILVEFDELGSKDLLTHNEVQNIDSYKQKLLDYIKRINDINPGIDPNFNKDIKDQIENDIEHFYNSSIEYLRGPLTYLRQEAALESRDQQTLQEQQKEALKARKEYQRLAREMNRKLQEYKKREKELEAAPGKVASKLLAYHFEKQANDYTSRAGDNFYSSKNGKGKKGRFDRILAWVKKPRSWRTIRSIFWWTLLFIIGFNFVLYLLIFFLHKLGKIELAVTDIFTLEYGIIKLALISLLYYGMHFASRNYNIVSNLEAITRHRKNVALTLEDFLATNPDERIRSEMIKHGMDAMFRHLPTGYIRKSGKDEDGGSIIKSFTNILRQDKE